MPKPRILSDNARARSNRQRGVVELLGAGALAALGAVAFVVAAVQVAVEDRRAKRGQPERLSVIEERRWREWAKEQARAA